MKRHKCTVLVTFYVIIFDGGGIAIKIAELLKCMLCHTVDLSSRLDTLNDIESEQLSFSLHCSSNSCHLDGISVYNSASVSPQLTLLYCKLEQKLDCKTRHSIWLKNKG